MSADRGVGGPTLPVAKPLGTVQLRPGGLCGCRRCLAHEQRENETKDKALAAIVYDLGADVLRADALRRVTPFKEAFR